MQEITAVVNAALVVGKRNCKEKLTGVQVWEQDETEVAEFTNWK